MKLSDENIERLVLSTLIENDFLIKDVVGRLKSIHFENNLHKEIFKAINTLYEKNAKITDFAILSMLGQEFNESIINITKVPPLNELDYYVGVLITLFQKRQIYKLTFETQKDLATEDLDTLLETIKSKIEDIEKEQDNFIDFYETEADLLRQDFPPIPKYKTGINFVDTILNGGLPLGEFMFISGKAETGKTYLGTRMLENISNTQLTCFLCLEFGKRQRVEKLKALKKITHNTANVAIRDNIYDISELEKMIKSYVRKRDIKFFFVDSQLRITNKELKNNVMSERISNIFNRLGRLCQSLNITIMMVVQTSKDDHKTDEISVKGSIEADHEATFWLHFKKVTFDSKDWEKFKKEYKFRHKEEPKEEEFKELRKVIVRKNKITHKHPELYILFKNGQFVEYDFSPQKQEVVVEYVKQDEDGKTLLDIDGVQI